MKLTGIGDLFIPEKYIEEGFRNLKKDGIKINTVQWKINSFQELQRIAISIEKSNSDYYEPPDCILEKLHDANILITHFCPITKRVIDNSPKLKTIGVLRSGYQNINIDYASKKNIIVFNTPGRNADSVADFTIGMIIAECRNIAKGHNGIKTGTWIRDYPNSGHIPDLPGKTVGIIGLGEIGKKVAKRLSGFDVKLLGYDPFVDKVENMEMVSLKKLMADSDFVTIHAKLNEKTKEMIGEEHFKVMKSTAYFINTSRAGLIDEKALYNVLKNNSIAGAALDVFEKEPPGKDYPLVKLENVTVTPHMAGGSSDAFINSPKLLAREIHNYLQGLYSKFIVSS